MLYLDNNLSFILSKKQSPKSFGAFFDTIKHINSCLELSFSNLLLKLTNGFGELLSIIKVQEALHCRPLGNKSCVILELVGILGPICTNQSTQNNSGLISDIHENIIQHLATNIVKIYVNAIRVQFL